MENLISELHNFRAAEFVITSWQCQIYQQKEINHLKIGSMKTYFLTEM